MVIPGNPYFNYFYMIKYISNLILVIDMLEVK